MGSGEHPCESSLHFPSPSHSKGWLLQAFSVLFFPDFPFSGRCTVLYALYSHPNPVAHFSGLTRGHFVQARGMYSCGAGWQGNVCLWVTVHVWAPAPSPTWLELERPRTLLFPQGIVRHFSKLRPGQETPAISLYLRTHIWPLMWFNFVFFCFLQNWPYLQACLEPAYF